MVEIDIIDLYRKKKGNTSKIIEELRKYYPLDKANFNYLGEIKTELRKVKILGSEWPFSEEISSLRGGRQNPTLIICYNVRFYDPELDLGDFIDNFFSDLL